MRKIQITIIICFFLERLGVIYTLNSFETRRTDKNELRTRTEHNKNIKTQLLNCHSRTDSASRLGLHPSGCNANRQFWNNIIYDGDE